MADPRRCGAIMTDQVQFDSGMIRDQEEGKIDFTNILWGPMLVRWAAHLTLAKKRYPDAKLGIPNWTLAAGEEELIRFKRSAFRHFLQWMSGANDEDHAAAIFFNVNGAEYVQQRMYLDRLKETISADNDNDSGSVGDEPVPDKVQPGDLPPVHEE